MHDAYPDHPRPQRVRDSWRSLDGPWRFAVDDADVGRRQRWHEPGRGAAFTTEIIVPFPPESRASGIADTGFHPVVWYKRSVELVPARGRRVLLHFGAVDHDADVWVDGQHVGAHRGGYTAFTIDITDALTTRNEHEIVVRAHDDPADATLPRGKQDWELEPHVVWYHRSTGIWRTVWLEDVPDQHLADLAWSVDLAAAQVQLELNLAAVPSLGTTVTVVLEHAGQPIASTSMHAHSRANTLTVPVPALGNGQAREAYLWTPENPVLLDATITVTSPGQHADTVFSYVGLRTVSTESGRFILNERPYQVRAVLEQGYWPDSLYTAPDPTALRDEVELIRTLGFNTARIHQKVEDSRMLYWADRLGLMLWAEMPSAYRFSPQSTPAIMAEWLDAVQQQRNHPSVVTWVPLNESWGVQDVATNAAQQAFARALADATRALDPSRPVISNDGWQHQNSDIIGIHDYEGDPDLFANRYREQASREDLLEGFGPAGRRILIGGYGYSGQPIMVTEFGGIAYQPGTADADGWGYAKAKSEEDWLNRIAGLYRGIRNSQFLAGSCYTQFTDTLQEANGLCTSDRKPKAAIEKLRAAILGEAVDP